MLAHSSENTRDGDPWARIDSVPSLSRIVDARRRTTSASGLEAASGLTPNGSPSAS